MKIVVNGAWRELALAGAAMAPTLETVLGQLGFTNRTVATALNGGFIAAGARAATEVHEGDRVEIVAPMQGG
jgi:sulfur carrier protein